MTDPTNKWRIEATIEWSKNNHLRTAEVPTFWIHRPEHDDMYEVTRFVTDMILDVYGEASTISVKATNLMQSSLDWIPNEV